MTIPTNETLPVSPDEESEPEDEKDPISLQGKLVSFRRRYAEVLGAATIREAGARLHAQILSAVGNAGDYTKIIASIARRRGVGEQLHEHIQDYKRKTISIAHLQFSRAASLEKEVNAMVCMYGELEVLLESGFELYMESWSDKTLNWQTY
jgi:hypothetical protein